MLALFPWDFEYWAFLWCCTIHISLHGVPTNGCRCCFCFTFYIWTGKVSVTFQMFWALHWQKNMYRQRWSNAHVIAELGWFNGYVCHFPFTLSFIFRPDALRIWPYPLPEQHTILIPCGCKVWTEEHRTSSTSQSSCSSRLISSSGMAEHLRILSCTQSTSIGTALHCRKMFCFPKVWSFNNFPGYSRVTYQMPQQFLRVWKQGVNGWHLLMQKDASAFTLFSFFDVQRCFSFQKVLKQNPSKSWPAVPEFPPEELWLLFVCLY